MTRMTPSEQLDNCAITREVADDARSTREEFRKLDAEIAELKAERTWKCGARAQGTAGGNDPADCDWPTCGCDPYATKVIDALIEQGHLVSDHS
jgi:hypothetical protein